MSIILSLTQIFKRKTPQKVAVTDLSFDNKATIPQNIFDIISAYPLSQHAHVNIDQQRDFCDPKVKKKYGLYCTQLAAQQAEKLVQASREFNIQNYIVYLDQVNWGVSRAKGGLYLIQPNSSDILVPKTETSAIEGSDILDQFLERKHKVLWLSGFNTSACLKETAYDLLKYQEFQIMIIKDATENCLGFHARAKQNSLDYLEANGAHIVTSNQMYNFLANKYYNKDVVLSNSIANTL